MSEVAAAYSATGGSWQRGPGRVYDRLAEVVVARSPMPFTGWRVLDLGAGTGAASRAALGAGATHVVAVDAAVGMLAHDAVHRPPAVAGDAIDLPFTDASFDAVVAAFSLNHLTAPAAGLREAARLVRSGGVLLAAAYAYDDTHPVKGAVEAALIARGWVADPWCSRVREDATPKMATPTACEAAAAAAGLEADVVAVRVPFPELDADDLVAWRLGMAQHAPFLASLPSDAERAAVAADATARLGESWPPLERSILVVRAVRS